MLARPLLREHFQIFGSFFFFFYRVQTLQFYWIGTAVLSKRLGFFSPGLPNYLERSVRVNIGCPVVRTGLSFVRSAYGEVIATFSEMGRFTYPWCLRQLCY